MSFNGSQWSLQPPPYDANPRSRQPARNIRRGGAPRSRPDLPELAANPNRYYELDAGQDSKVRPQSAFHPLYSPDQALPVHRHSGLDSQQAVNAQCSIRQLHDTALEVAWQTAVSVESDLRLGKAMRYIILRLTSFGASLFGNVADLDTVLNQAARRNAPLRRALTQSYTVILAHLAIVIGQTPSDALRREMLPKLRSLLHSQALYDDYSAFYQSLPVNEDDEIDAWPDLASAAISLLRYIEGLIRLSPSVRLARKAFMIELGGARRHSTAAGLPAQAAAGSQTAERQSDVQSTIAMNEMLEKAWKVMPNTGPTASGGETYGQTFEKVRERLAEFQASRRGRSSHEKVSQRILDVEARLTEQLAAFVSDAKGSGRLASKFSKAASPTKSEKIEMMLRHMEAAADSLWSDRP